MRKPPYRKCTISLAALALLLPLCQVDSRAQAASAPSPGVFDGALAPLGDTFNLHSKPDSKKTIMLNFRGSAPINNKKVLPFDMDGKPDTFSDNELKTIQYIWQRISEDYAPFDVDVTTEAVLAARIDRSSTRDDEFGIEVLFTDHRGWVNSGTAGKACIACFHSVGYKPPAMVFENLGEVFSADAASHEVGHTLGLSHDGKDDIVLWQGYGKDLVMGWSPIMGGLGGPLSQFSKGEYDGATNREDDFAVMQTYGLNLRADDVGDTIDLALPLASGSPHRGVIEKAGDTDVFLVSAGAGTLTAQVKPAARAPNADLVLTLLDKSGKVVASSNPVEAFDASLSLKFKRPGTYFLTVKGTGKGNPRSDGYSDYGSVGFYTLSANFTPMSSKTAPVAAFAVSPATGDAPLAVTLDGRKSASRSRVRFWYWDFGDGTSDKTGSLTTARKTYAVPGTYVATLRVVDRKGFSSTTRTTINVTERLTPMSVAWVDVTLSPFSRGATSYASGTVSVVDEKGEPVAGAQVSMEWTGPFSASYNKTWDVPTNAAGKVTVFSPPLSTTAPGCFQLTVTHVAADHYMYRAPATGVSKTQCN